MIHWWVNSFHELVDVDMERVVWNKEGKNSLVCSMKVEGGWYNIRYQIYSNGNGGKKDIGRVLDKVVGHEILLPRLLNLYSPLLSNRFIFGLTDVSQVVIY